MMPMHTSGVTQPATEFVFRPRGWGRYIEAAFLIVWLCGWVVGEAFALWFLGAAAWSVVSGQRLEHQPATIAGVLGVGGFLFAWIALWTVGGWAAGHQLLRILWGEDRLVLEPDHLQVVHRAGPRRRTQLLSRAEVVAFYRNDGRTLMAEGQRRSIELTSLADAPALDRLLAELNAWRACGATPPPPPAELPLPESWEEVRVPEGGVVLTGSRRHRRNAARVLGGFALLLTGAAALIGFDRADSGATRMAAITGGLALLVGVWAWWARTSRREWKIEPGGITLQRRTGSRVQALFHGRRLEIAVERDSDGDVWSKLILTDEPTGWKYGAKRSPHRVIVRQVNDSWEPRRVGAWLAHRTGIQVH